LNVTPPSISTPDYVVRTEGLEKHFVTPAGKLHVLQGLDLRVPRGETVAIVGESGSGKSTLLSLLAGLDVPSDGRLEVDGIDPAATDEAGLAQFRSRTISIVFQHFHLMKSLSALENVRLPLELRGDPDAAGQAERAERALADVGLAERAQHFPAQLSGGECQRVALARAMVTRPSLLLADEPTGNLDEKTGRRVMDLLFAMVEASATSMILVTHSDVLAARCSRVLVLAGGRLTDANGAAL
jgi:putative ABC transport system ATP-binding protein